MYIYIYTHIGEMYVTPVYVGNISDHVICKMVSGYTCVYSYSMSVYIYIFVCVYIHICIYIGETYATPLWVVHECVCMSEKRVHSREQTREKKKREGAIVCEQATERKGKREGGMEEERGKNGGKERGRER